MTGKTFRSMVAWRMPAFSSAIEGVSPSRNFSSSTSSVSAMTSINCSRKASAFFSRLAGTSSTEYSAPMVSSCQRIAFISIRSMTPLKPASAPMGICSATGRAPSRLRMVSRTCSKSAPFLSILFTKQMRGTLILVALPPHGLGLRLHAGDGIKQRHRAVEHAQRPLHLGRKVHVAGGVDDIDADVFPGAGGGRRSNRDAALLLLLHVVHGRRALMHFADAVRDARIEQDALRRCRLSGVDVRHDSDVPATIQRYGASHGNSSLRAICPRFNLADQSSVISGQLT